MTDTTKLPPGTELAPRGKVWVCQACGKRSRTRYGFDAEKNRVCDHGWDESCMMNAELITDVNETLGGVD